MKISKRYFRSYTWASLITVFAMLVSACGPQAADEPSSLAALVAVGQTATARPAAGSSASGPSNSIAAESNTVISGNIGAGSADTAAPLPANVQPQTANSILPLDTSVVSGDDTSVVLGDDTSVVSGDDTSVVLDDDTPVVLDDDTPVVLDDDTSVVLDDDTSVVSDDDTSVVSDDDTSVSDAQVLLTDTSVATVNVQTSTVNTVAVAPQISDAQTSKLSNTSSDVTAAPVQISQLAWFPKPPADNNLDTLAANFDVFILTHKDEPTRDALRAKGVTAPILQYLRFEAIHDPGSCTATPRGNQAAYLPGDFCDISTNHSDWFLLDSGGKRIKLATDTATYYRMNPGSQGWREFYARRAGEMKKQFGWDGLFMDHSLTGLSTKADIEGFLSYVRNNYSGQLYANISGLPNHSDGVYDRYLDGMMIEAWSLGWKSEYLSTSSWNSQLTRAEKIQAAGKKVILVTQGAQTDTTKQSFAYASYMLIANSGAFFRYANSSSYNQAWLYPSYNVDLGAPLGGRYQVGALWQRDFALGTLIVDPVAHKITFKPKKQIPTLTKTATKVPTQTATKIPTQTATKVLTQTATKLPTQTYTATPLPTSTPAFTATAAPTFTSVPPTATAAPPTATSIPPTAIPTTGPGTNPAPVAGQLCPAWVHDRNTTVAPDSLTYPTWHPQVDPEFGCYFDHEHGADPRTSLADPSLPAFGYINAFVHQDHIAHEPHNGFKVFVVNKGTTNDEGRTATVSTRIVAHMGTGGPARFDNQFHSLEFDLVANDGHYVHVQGMADTGGVGSICNSPRQGKTVMILPGLGCDRDSPYEIWQFKLNIGGKVTVLVAAAVFDPITVMNPADHTQLLYTAEVFASRANEAPFMPPFAGCDRESYSGPVYWYNQGGSTVYYTDPMGMIVNAGPLKQEVSAHKDIGIPMNQDQTQMKLRVNFCAPGLGPKN